jgi:hypothetical protein
MHPSRDCIRVQAQQSIAAHLLDPWGVQGSPSNGKTREAACLIADIEVVGKAASSEYWRRFNLILTAYGAKP